MPAKNPYAHQNIVEACRKELLKGGYSNVDIRKLMSACHMTTSNFYRYFSTKDEVVMDVLDADWNKMLQDIEKIDSTDLSVHDELKNVYQCIQNFMNQFHVLEMPKGKLSPVMKDGIEKALLRCSKVFMGLAKEGMDKQRLSVDVSTYAAAHYMIVLMIDTIRNSTLDFEDLWKFLNSVL